MNLKQTLLYDKIQNFELDQTDAAWSFSQRLAQENQWSAKFTQQAIAEYKKFVFLAVSSDQMVVPSEAIDRVWHLHLTYTRSYWELFCGEVLEKPLHHIPSAGGAQEQQQFINLYQQTLETYETTFGTQPPADVWPSPAIRFSQPAHSQSLSQSDAWVLPKPSWLNRLQSSGR